MRVNPAYQELIDDAQDEYESFHWGRPSERVDIRKVNKPLRVGTKLGELVEVTYRTRKGDEDGGRPIHWVHQFGEEGGRQPDLVMDAETRRLHIVGGTYRVEEPGIID